MSAGERWLCRSTIGACSATLVEEHAGGLARRAGSRRSGSRSPSALIQIGHRAEAAVDDELGAGDEPAGVAREQQRRSRPGRRASPKRPSGVWPTIAAVRSGVRIVRFCSAGKKPGTSTLQRMPSGPHSRARFLVRLCTAAFVMRVREHARQRREAGRAADVDDARPLAGRLRALDEVAPELLARAHDGELVDRDEPLELLVGDLEERRRRVDAGAVDEDVDRPCEASTRATRSRSSARLVASHGSNVDVAAVQRSRSSAASPSRAVAPDDHRASARLGERLRHPAAERPGAADDHGNPSVQPEARRQIRWRAHAAMLTRATYAVPPTPRSGEPSPCRPLRSRT